MAMDQIDGLSPEAGEKLKAIGIEKLMDLRMTGKTPEGRADIASKTGLSLDDVNRWVDQAVAIRKVEQAAKADAAPAPAPVAGGDGAAVKKYKLSDIEGVPLDALKAVGIEKLKDLRMNARTPDARAELARKIGTSQDDVNRWVAQAFEYKKIEDAAAAAGASTTIAAPDATAAQPASAPAASSPAAPALIAPATPAPAQPSQTAAGVAPDQKIEPAAAAKAATATTVPNMVASAAAPAAPARPAIPSAPPPASPVQPAAQPAPSPASPARDAPASPAPDMTNRLDMPVSAGTSGGTLFGKFREAPRATNSLSALIQKAQAGSRRSPQPTQGGPGVGKTLGDILALLLNAGGSARPGGAGGPQINWPGIGQIKGVDSARAQKLQSAGIVNAADLLRLTQTPQARKDLASKMGVPESMVLLWLGDVINTQAPQVAKAQGIDLMEIVDLEELDTLIEETEIYDVEFEEVEIYEIDEIEYEEEEDEEEEEEEEEDEEEEDEEEEDEEEEDEEEEDEEEEDEEEEDEEEEDEEEDEEEEEEEEDGEGDEGDDDE